MKLFVLFALYVFASTSSENGFSLDMSEIDDMSSGELQEYFDEKNTEETTEDHVFL